MIRAALLFATATLPLFAGAEPNLFFSKNFPNSVPAYQEIKLSAKGEVEYREQEDEENPVVFKLTPAETAEVFDLAGRLGHFDRKLESGLPVARMGEKTFRWTSGAEKREQKFNYTQDPDGQALLDWFEKIGESALRFIDLERASQFDKLGVNKSLLLLESQRDRGRLVGPDQFLPLLDKIARKTDYINLARERAAKLAEAFRNPPPKAAAKEDGKPQ